MSRYFTISATYAFLSAWSGLALSSAGGIDPANSDTTAYTSPNGVPVVHIVKPTDSGLSHNKYNGFSVGQEGVVLNNTTEVLKSQLAGAIRGNNNLTKGKEARIILNEVVQSNRSVLNGFVEVHGVQADVIIANPYGITADGVGFINTSRATLTTGVPQTDASGNLNGFRVEQGDIAIQGDGVNGSNQAYLDLVTRSLQVDGRVTADNLHITTGTNDWQYADRSATANTSTGTAPNYAIDSSTFGGMYANKIQVVATEEGVGVRMRGDMAANAEDLFISSKGQLTLNNQISAAKDVQLVQNSSTSGDKITIDGASASVTASNNLSITSNKDVEVNQATLKANQNLSINAATLTDTGTTTNTRAADGNIDITTSGKTTINGTKWVAGDAITATTGEFAIGADAAQLFSGTDNSQTDKHFFISSYGDIDLAAAEIGSAGNIDVLSRGGEVKIGGGSRQKIQAQNDITIDAVDTFLNEGVVIAGNDLSLYSASPELLSFTNTGRLEAANQLYLDGHGQVNDELAIINNAGGVLLGGTLVFKAKSLTNAVGASIQGTNGGTVNVQYTLDNDGTFVASNTADQNTIFNLGSLDNAGNLKGKGDLTFNVSEANSLINSGTILAENALEVRYSTETSRLNLTNSGTMQAGGLLDLAGFNGNSALNISNTGNLLGNSFAIVASSLTNQSGAMLQSTSGGSISLDGTFTNDGDFIAVNDNAGTLSLTSLSLTNQGEIFSNHALAINTTGNIDNKSSGQILATNLNLTGAELLNAGAIQAAQQSTLDFISIDNDNRLILSTASGGNNVITTGVLDNSSVLQSVADTTITLKNAGSLDNAANAVLLVTNGILTINTNASSGTAQVTNAGIIQALNGVDIQGNNASNNISLSNALGAKVKGGGIRINGTTVDNSGTIQSDTGQSDTGVIDIDVVDYNNNGASALLLNVGSSSSDVTVTGTLKNEGAIHSNGDLTINASTLTNTSTAGISSTADLTLITSNTFDNYGALYSGNDLALTAAYQTVTNQASGTIDSSNDITIDVGTLNNYNDIQASNNITINTVYEFNNLLQVLSGTLEEEVIEYHAMTKSEFENSEYAYVGPGDSSSQNGYKGTNLIFNPYDGSYGSSCKFSSTDACAWFSRGSRLVSVTPGDSSDPKSAGNWGIYQYFHEVFDDGDKLSDSELTDFYGYVRGQKKLVKKNVRSADFSADKSVIRAGGTLKINIGSGKGVNKGSVLSASTITLNGSGDFTNDALEASTETFYSRYVYHLTLSQDPGHSDGHPHNSRYYRTESSGGQALDNPRSSSSWDDRGSESAAMAYAIGNPEAVSSESNGGIGAGIFANTINGSLGGTLTNEGGPTGASPVAVSKTGVDGASSTATVSANSRAQNGSSFGSGLSALGLDLSLPTNPNGLFVTSKSSDANYLIESNPLFGLDASYLGADYLINQLSDTLKPDDYTRRLGDAAYENHLISKQILSQTGRNVLDRYSQNAQDQAKALFDNAAQVAGNLGLTLGQALTPDQVRNLSQDIVWMVKQTVEVAGQQVEVLAPVVYLAPSTIDNLNASGSAQIAADNIDLDVGSLKNNSGTIEGSENLTLRSKDGMVNAGGDIKGGNVSLTADSGDIRNTAGLIKGETLSVQATQGSIINETLAKTTGSGTGIDDTDGVATTKTRFSETASIEATNSLNLGAGKDISSTAARIKSGDDATLNADGNIQFNALTNASGSRTYETTSEKGFEGYKSTVSQQGKSVGSTLQIGGDATLDAGKDITAVGAKLKVDGDADIKTGGDLKLLAAEEYSRSKTKSESSRDLWIFGDAKKEDVKVDKSTTAKASALDVGRNLTVNSSGDVELVGSKLEAKGNATINARDVKVSAAKETSYTSDKKSSNYGFIGKIAGANKSEQDVNSKTTYSDAKSSIKTGGNLTIDAKRDLIVKSSDLEAGANADVSAGRDQKFLALSDQTVTQKSVTEDKGFSFYAEADGGTENGGANGDAGAGIQFISETTTTTSTKKRAVVSEIKAGGNLDRSAGNILADQGTKITAGGDYSQTAKEINNYAAENSDTTTTSTRTDRARYGLYVEGEASQNVVGDDGLNFVPAPAGDVSVGAGVEQRFKTTTDTTTKTDSKAVVSTITAGGNVTSNSDNKTTFEGTKVDAGGTIDITAKDLEVKAARDKTTTSTTVDTSEKYMRLGGEAGVEAGISSDGKPADAGAGVALTIGYDKSTEQDKSSSDSAVVASFKSGKTLNVTTTNDATFEGTDINAAKGASVDAGGNVAFNAAQNTKSESSSESSHGGYIKGTLDASGAPGGGVGFSTANAKDDQSSSTARVSNINTGSGGLTISSGKDVTLEGVKGQGRGGLDIDADGNVNITAAKDTSKGDTSSFSLDTEVEGSKSGFKLKLDVAESKGSSSSSTEKGATLNFGSVDVDAGKDINLVGTQIQSGGEVDLDAQGKVNKKAAKSESSSFNRSLSAGISISAEKGDSGGDTSSRGGGAFGGSFDSSKDSSETGVKIQAKSTNIQSGE